MRIVTPPLLICSAMASIWPGSMSLPRCFCLMSRQVYAVSLGPLADLLGGLHVRGVNGAVHAEPVEDLLGLGDQRFGRLLAHELGEIRLSQLVDEIELSVGKQPRTADTAQNVARGASYAFLALVDRTVAGAGFLSLFDQKHF